MKKIINKYSDDYSKLLSRKDERKIKKIAKKAVKSETEDKNIVFYDILKKEFINKPLFKLISLSDENYRSSLEAQMKAGKNPLLNVSLFGVARKIKGSTLNKNETFLNFLKNKKDADVRLERNVLVLETAKKVSKSLKKTYKETLSILEKYHKTKDETILIPVEEEKIDLSDAYKYFESGNWSHVYLDSKKLLDKNLTDEELREKYKISLEELENIHQKAKNMREKVISEAINNEKENLDNQKKLLIYNDLIEDSRKQGKDKKFNEAVELLKKAEKILPDNIEAKWGLATAYFHQDEIDKSIEKYKYIIERFPNNYKFQFELGQVLLYNGDINEGLDIIGKVMTQTNEFDGFFGKMGEIYEGINNFEKARISYKLYLDRMPYNVSVLKKYRDCLKKLDDKEKEVIEIEKRIEMLNN
jgi:tetratricopeptide (TPR) repeat protein